MTITAGPPSPQRSLPLAGVTERKPRATRHRVMAVVVAAYIGAAGLAALLAEHLPVPRWLALHLLLLGAATNAIFVWSRHFAQALLHARLASERAATARLGGLNAGIGAVLVGVSGDIPWLLTAGAALVIAAVVAHGVSLVLMALSCPFAGRLRATVWFYVASSAALAVGAVLGGLVATVLDSGSQHVVAHLAHAHVNVLGWIGFAVLGTLFMLWPAVLRTRMSDDAPRVAWWVLAVVVTGLAVTVGGLLLEATRVAAVGVATYAAGVALSLVPAFAAAWRRPPHTAAAVLLTVATTWFVAALAVDTVALLRGVAHAEAAMDTLVPMLGIGLVAQVLTGALTFLLPVTIGGGPAGNKRLAAVLEIGWLPRVVLTNAGLLASVLPLPPVVRTFGTALALVGVASFVPLALTAVAVSRRPLPAPGESPPPPESEARGAAGDSLAVGCLLVVVAVVAVIGTGAWPRSAPAAAPAGARTVSVVLGEFTVTPARVSVAAGTHLVLEVRNDGAMRHDLRVQHAGTPRLSSGQSARLDVGVVRGAMVAWCTLAGHRQNGMELAIDVVGELPAAGDGHSHGSDRHSHGEPAAPAPAAPPTANAPLSSALSMTAPVAPTWQARDATLAPAPAGTLHRVSMAMVEKTVEVAPGVWQSVWTFDGAVPGPTLRGRVGDVFEVTVTNRGTIEHSIDFHASRVAPDRLMRPIKPGETQVYRFRAERAGAWLYHCGTAPMLQHVAMGMYGAVIIDPPGLARVAKELVLVQSELTLGADRGAPDLGRLTRGEYDLAVFNGYANQYAHRPVTVRTGERVRVWVVAAGPSGSSAFHVVGTQFDTVYAEGGYLLRRGHPGAGGSQVLSLAPSAGGFVEFALPERGRYPFVSHRLADAARGAMGVLVAE